MKRLLCLFLILILCISPVLAIRDSFRDFVVPSNTSASSLTYVGAGGTPWIPRMMFPTVGNVSMESFWASGSYLINKRPSAFSYAAADTSGFGYKLLDASGNELYSGGGVHYEGRFELKIIGMQPTECYDGVCNAPGTAISIYPSYMAWTSGRIQNLVVGETDRHIVASIPVNWTIQRDLLNPVATGVYAWSGSAWVLEDSNFVYMDADKEYGSVANPLPENVVIKDFATQTTVYTVSVPYVRNQIKYNLTELLNTPTSLGTSLPDGMYTISFESSPAITDSFWITSSGAVVSWDKAKYAGGDTAVLTYAISPAYFTSDYTYKLDVLNMYGTVVNTQTISAASGTKTISNLDSTTYAPGVYWAVVRATTVADGTVHDLAVSPMETIAYVLFNGYVMNENGAVLTGASVNLTQGTSTLVSTSGSGGIWNSSNNWASGMQINITTTLAGYTPDTLLITPLSAKSIPLNITLVSSPPVNATNSIGGVVHDNVYGNPVVGATVTAMNATKTLTNVSNIAGYYRHDSLSMTYNVWANKTGYANSSVSVVNASISSFNRTDLIMYPSFLFTGNIVDATTNSPIPIVSVIDSNAWRTNTTTGTFSNTYNYSVVTFYLSSSGYDSKSYSYIIDSNRTETMELSATVPVVSPVKNTWYTMQLVQISIVDNYGNPIPTANLSVRYIASTLPSTNKSWLTSAFGVDDTVASQMTDSGLAMTGTTSDDGSLTFMMFPALTYGVTISDATTGMSNYVRLSPKDTSYVITCPLPTQGKTPGIDKMTQLINSSLYVSEPNTSFITWNLIYQDTSGYTTALTWNVTCWNNMTVMYTRTYGSPGSTGIIRDNYTFPSVPAGVEYRALYTATRNVP